MLQCINCDQEALWVFRTTGAVEQPYCAKHLPIPYRGSGSLHAVESPSEVEEPESAPAEESHDEPEDKPEDDPKPKPTRRRRKKDEADE